MKRWISLLAEFLLTTAATACGVLLGAFVWLMLL